MSTVLTKVRDALANGRYAFSHHAMLRLRQRRIPGWQVVAGTQHGVLLRDREDAEPNPACEVRILLADGAEAVAVWAWLRTSDAAKLVTVYFPEP